VGEVRQARIGVVLLPGQVCDEVTHGGGSVSGWGAGDLAPVIGSVLEGAQFQDLDDRKGSIEREQGPVRLA
jgi:hypothetical protein